MQWGKVYLKRSTTENSGRGRAGRQQGRLLEQRGAAGERSGTANRELSESGQQTFSLLPNLAPYQRFAL
jgi:hypothetical protein